MAEWTGQFAVIAATAAGIMAALAMGFAIQRGGTCMVAAVDQFLQQGAGKRLLALLECSLWTSALGLGAVAAGFHFNASPAYSVGLWTLAGGLLLGLGAAINGACVFGAIARIGSRDWHYLLTPPGFLLGGLLHSWLIGPLASALPSTRSVGWIALLAPLVVASVAYSLIAARRQKTAWGAFFDYRHATISIGLAFVLLAVVAGPWTYTEALARASHNGTIPRTGELLLFAALLIGAVLGGWRNVGAIPLRPGRALQCLIGGMFMGFGGSLVPGGNDNLILVGLPTFQAHAWLAVAAMVIAIGFGLKVARFWSNILETRPGAQTNST
ncbi:MAG: hypothetical protein APF82_10795 [Sphingomonadales bacterium BRH_c42]|nr:MAG: hypothetical protein APF82_10795 [Sphingomonadales bacterium BRH_c42]